MTILNSILKKYENSRDTYIYPVLISALVILALILRIIKLNNGLWVDEIYSLVEQFRMPLHHIFTVYHAGTQHPLYSILAHLSLTFFGEHAWSIRLPAVIFGVISIPALYMLGKVVTTKFEALLSAAFLTVSYHHVWFSQNARGYTGLVLCTILSSYFFIRGINDQRARYFLWYAIVTALGIYIHLTMVFITVSHFLICGILRVVPGRLGKRLKTWRLPLLGFILSAVLTFALYGPILTQVVDYFLNKPPPLQMVSLSTPLWALNEMIRLLKSGLGAGVGLVIGTIIFCAGLWSFLRSNPLALLIFILPGLVIFFGVFIASSTTYPRFFFSLIGFGILIGVRGAMATAKWISHRLSTSIAAERLAISGGAILIGFMILLSTVSLAYNYRFPKQDFQGAIHWVQSQANINEVVATTGAATWPYKNYFNVSWHAIEKIDQITEHRLNSRGVWMVYTFPRYLEFFAPDVMTAIRNDCQDTRVFRGTLGGGEHLCLSL